MQYYDPNDYKYFFGRLSQEESEIILRNKGLQTGLFLLRSLLCEHDAYAISICINNKQIKHYKIVRDENNHLISLDGSKLQFIGPIELVKHLQQHETSLVIKPTIECQRLLNTKPVHYLFISNEDYEREIKHQINLAFKDKNSDDYKNAQGKLRYQYERLALRNIHLTQKWYKADINKSLADDLFEQNGLLSGKFLLRSTYHALGSRFKLSVCVGNDIIHYKIKYNDGRYMLEGSVGEEFEFLAQLIDYYGRQRGFLKVKLIMPYYVNFKNEQYICDTNSYYESLLENNQNRADACEAVINKAITKDLVFKIPNLIGLEEIGSGNFSIVYKGIYKPLNSRHEIEVAIKVLKEKSGDLASELELSKLMHSNIVKLIELPELNAIKDLHDTVIVLEYAKLGALNSYLRKHGHKIDLMTLFKYMQQISSALSYIASKNLIHRDIAARNVLLFSNDLAKLSDFGLSRKLNEKNYYNSRMQQSLPVQWYPSEVLKEQKFSEKSDVYSYGILLWETFSYGKRPFEANANLNFNIRMFIDELIAGTLQPLEQPAKCSDELYELMKSCWNMDPKMRPTFADIEIRLADIAKIAIK